MTLSRAKRIPAALKPSELSPIPHNKRGNNKDAANMVTAADLRIAREVDDTIANRDDVVKAFALSVNQSYQISESLLHLKAFLMYRKAGEMPPVGPPPREGKRPTGDHAYIAQPINGKNVVWTDNAVYFDPSTMLVGGDGATGTSTANIAMIPLLSYYSGLGGAPFSGPKATRYVMLAAIRDDNKYAPMTRDVLTFASSVSSA